MSEPTAPDQHPTGSTQWLVTIILTLALYLASPGPVLALVGSSRFDPPQWVKIVYWPLQPVFYYMPEERLRPYAKYIEWWQRFRHP